MPEKVELADYLSPGAWEISKLMYDAGVSVDMNWACTVSLASLIKVPNAMKNNFQYQSANYSETDIYTKLETDVKAGYPVILGGNGHAFVCDGYQKERVEIKIPHGPHGYDWSTIYIESYHLNWGWDGMWNGWYKSLDTDFGDFSEDTVIVYNIRK